MEDTLRWMLYTRSDNCSLYWVAITSCIIYSSTDLYVSERKEWYSYIVLPQE